MSVAAPSLTTALKAEAARLGFTLSGVCAAIAPSGVQNFQQWLAAGYAGEMQYLPDRAAAYEHPRHVLDGVQSILMLGMDYRTAQPESPQPTQGRISRYAWGNDYHDLIRDRLNQLADFLRTQQPNCRVRGVIDTAPLLEREFAQLSGLGWIGKNTLLLNKQRGSWFFLAALLTDVPLDIDAPHQTDHCGTCTACLDACPTDAFVAPYVLDARKCISYLTIELRGAIPRELRAGVGDWLFGCDVCQDVCPWNHRAPPSAEVDFQPAAGANPLEIAELFALDEAGFRSRFRNSPLWRAKRRGMLRNAAIVLGNRPSDEAIEILRAGLQDIEPLVRGACAWALGQQRNACASGLLLDRFALEADESVRQEIHAALQAPNFDRA